MPGRKRVRAASGWLSRARLAFGAGVLAVVGLLAWFSSRRRAAHVADAPENRAHHERRALIARLRRNGYEPNDVKVVPIVAIGLLLLVLVTSSQFALWGFLRATTGTVPTPAAALHPLEAPIPRPAGLPTATVPALPARLPVRPDDWQRLRAEQEQRLERYGWVDRPAGVAHVPIARAIDLIVERGLPARGGR